MDVVLQKYFLIWQMKHIKYNTVNFILGVARGRYLNRVSNNVKIVEVGSSSLLKFIFGLVKIIKK